MGKFEGRIEGRAGLLYRREQLGCSFDVLRVGSHIHTRASAHDIVCRLVDLLSIGLVFSYMLHMRGL